VRIHAGEADDWTPAAPCAALAKSLKASGQNVDIDVYPGAHHAFDQASSYVRLPNVDNGSACFARLASILGPVLSSTRRCLTRASATRLHRLCAQRRAPRLTRHPIRIPSTALTLAVQSN
jgi:dienelactone hydrolase